MLTLKTKEKFEEWLIPELRKLDYVDETYYDKELIDGFYQLPLVCQQALVVEFLTQENKNLFESIFYYEYRRTGFNDYNTALSKAISKADELFNLNNE